MAEAKTIHPRSCSARSWPSNSGISGATTPQPAVTEREPAMEAGVDTTVRDCAWIVGLIDARPEAEPTEDVP